MNSLASVIRNLRRFVIARLKLLDPMEPVARYERVPPGEPLPIDIKRLGRINGIGHRITERRQQGNRRIGWDPGHEQPAETQQLAASGAPSGHPAVMPPSIG